PPAWRAICPDRCRRTFVKLPAGWPWKSSDHRFSHAFPREGARASRETRLGADDSVLPRSSEAKNAVFETASVQAPAERAGEANSANCITRCGDLLAPEPIANLNQFTPSDPPRATRRQSASRSPLAPYVP